MAYIGRSPLYGSYEKQSLTADSSTTTFTLDYVVGSSSSIFVSVAGVPQEPEVAYNIVNGGTQIQFTAAPTSGDTVFLIFLGAALDVATLGSSAITSITEVTDPEGADQLIVYDSSANANKKLTLDNLVTGQTALTTGIQGADELIIYDNSASEIKKVNLDNLIIGQTELTTFDSNDVLLVYDTSATEIKKIQKSNLGISLSLTYTSGTFTGDGSTVAFTIDSGHTVDTLLVYVNGFNFIPTTDYTVSGTTLTFATAPASGAEIAVRYLALAGTENYTNDTATGDGSTVAFTIDSGRTVEDVLATVNGVTLVPTADYTISGTTLTFAEAPAASAEISFRYLRTS